MRKWYVIFLTLLLSPQLSIAQQNVIDINLGSGSSSSSRLISEGVKEVTVVVKYIPPKLMMHYSINLEYIENQPAPLKQSTERGSESGNAGVQKNNSTDPCTKFLNGLDNLNTSKAVVEHFKNAKDIDLSCHERALDKTTKRATFYVIPGYKVVATVSDMSGSVYELSVATPVKNWYSHVGFSFVHNRGVSYYSKSVEQISTDEQGITSSQTVHQITEQHNQDDLNYGASVLYTYGIHDFGDIWEFGFTAGLSANSDTIAVLIGPSLIVKKNILINLGIIFQEFEELSGSYEEGQILTNGAVDSSALTKDSFKPSVALTIGFNFGD